MSIWDYFGLGGNAQNVLTGGLTDQPDWNPSQLDAGTNQVISDQAALGKLSQQEIVNRELQGTNPTMAPAAGGAVAQQQQALGGSSNPAVTQALNDRANRLYANQYEQMRNAAVAGAPATQGRLMGQASNALQQQQNVNDELNRQQMAVTLQKWGMRNQIIGQLFGGAGNFAGTYAGMQGGRGAASAFNDQLQGKLSGMNAPTYQGDPNSYNLGVGEAQPTSPYGLGVDTSMMRPEPGMGYYGMTSPGEGQGFNGQNPYGGYQNNMNGGYGLGVSTNGLQ